MKTEQRKWTKGGGWETLSDNGLKDSANLVLVFGGRAIMESQEKYEEMKAMYPKSDILLCSTAGEIAAEEVMDDSISLTAVHFDKSKVQIEKAQIESADQSESTGKKLAEGLEKNGLVHVMVFSDGGKVNGTALVHGILSVLPKDVSVTGGLVGDGKDFKKTVVGLNSPGIEGQVVVIGFYGTDLKVGYGSLGGWDPFGPERVITKSANNVLYELDHKPALELYKEYLGEQAKGLPSSGLLFPLSLRLSTDKGDVEVVRTILGVNEKDQSMTFAGDMPEGVPAKLMKANFDRLIEGAGGAADMSLVKSFTKDDGPQLAVLISCVGRKLVLGARVEEEIEAVRERVGSQATMCGFYSYGEISPVTPTEKQCQLHNQTMTITTFAEA
jgi:hypothetical protein